MRKCWLVVAAAFMLGATLAIAQSVTGTITGTVKDPAGAVVTHAKVVARNNVAAAAFWHRIAIGEYI